METMMNVKEPIKTQSKASGISKETVRSTKEAVGNIETIIRKVKVLIKTTMETIRDIKETIRNIMEAFTLDEIQTNSFFRDIDYCQNKKNIIWIRGETFQKSWNKFGLSVENHFLIV